MFPHFITYTIKYLIHIHNLMNLINPPPDYKTNLPIVCPHARLHIVKMISLCSGSTKSNARPSSLFYYKHIRRNGID